ncbi:folylpolyglutamate synthase/dihydrofolate synthase family protein [Clostridium sp. BJN0013]|uniref:folylpolyglutamate synthase/dihydrofolate synthase family protein n=1 Tax=Clostridium sp. BJN0013 TaxID=3236840 RepID=UPI0034C6457F
MNYEDTLQYINNIAKFGVNLGLERTEKILELLDNPHKKIRTIHVAGTNGKGSITVMISKILMESGFKVGMYTSPYLEEFEERIQINGQNISHDDLSRVVTKVSKVVDRVLELGYDNPTEFEIITCAMFYYFWEKKVQIAVIEVGLGGRFDSTNVMLPFSKEYQGGVMASVIASISYDHMNILGDTLEKIAYEKAGIIKKGIPVILYPQPESVEKVISKICQEKGSELIRVPLNCCHFMGENKINNKSREYMQHIKVYTKKSNYDIKLSLLGKHQLLNCAVALFTLEQLSRYGILMDKSVISRALGNVSWKGRLEVMGKNPLVVIDGAHNIQGISMLKKNLCSYFQYNHMILILGILADKEVDTMVKTIVPIAERVIAVTPKDKRGEKANKLKTIIEKYNSNCEDFDDYEEAYRKALSYCSKEDLILVCGSLYVVGDMRKIIK